MGGIKFPLNNSSYRLRFNLRGLVPYVIDVTGVHTQHCRERNITRLLTEEYFREWNARGSRLIKKKFNLWRMKNFLTKKKNSGKMFAAFARQRSIQRLLWNAASILETLVETWTHHCAPDAKQADGTATHLHEQQQNGRGRNIPQQCYLQRNAGWIFQYADAASRGSTCFEFSFKFVPKRKLVRWMSRLLSVVDPAAAFDSSFFEILSEFLRWYVTVDENMGPTLLSREKTIKIVETATKKANMTDLGESLIWPRDTPKKKSVKCRVRRSFR